MAAARSRRLFRWVGSKAHVAQELAPAIVSALGPHGRLISPFYGSGAVEQAVAELDLKWAASGHRGPHGQIAAEKCPGLRSFYASLRRNPHAVFFAVRDLDRLVGLRTKAAYRRVQGFEPGTDLMAAARFLWLQTLAFNGLWRVNKKGEHNVSPDPARLVRAPFPPVEEYLRVAPLLPPTLDEDWSQVIQLARPGDVIFADPPFVETFGNFTGGGFNEHLEVALALRKAAESGVAVVAFNSPRAEPLYTTWAKTTVLRRSGCVSSNGSGRQPVRELLFTSGIDLPALSTAEAA